ncbi:alpha-2-macroglobulin, partial [bacterium]|nr:alpha-2-macroglobulin [bacterium]
MPRTSIGGAFYRGCDFRPPILRGREPVFRPETIISAAFHFHLGDAMNRSLRLALLSLFLTAGMTQAASVRQFQPQGRIDQQNRATAIFTSDMVKLGETAGPEPFNVNCGSVAGEGRWVDPKTWAWQLARPLQPGERCEFTLKPDLKALNGEGMGGKNVFSFYASGPWPRSILPRPGGPVEEDQAFIINGGGSLDRVSVEKNVWCEADGVGNRIPVRFLPDEQRRDILAHAYGNHGPDPVVVSCAERLPPGAKMKLVWGKGVMAANGTPTEKEESFVFTVREPFRATLSCEREKAGAPCSPLSSVSVEFSAHTDAKLLQKIRLVTPDGARSPKDPNKDSSQRENMARSVTFPGPFPQNAEFTLELPAGLKDDAGRPLANGGNFPLKFRTGALPPLAKFPGSFGIVELKEGGLLPVTLRNVEAKLATAGLKLPGSHRFGDQRLTEDGDVIAAMKALAKFEQQTKTVKVNRDGRLEDYVDPFYARELSFLDKRPGVMRQELPKPGGSAEFEVVGIPLSKPGYHIVEIESRLLGASLLSAPKPMYVRTAVLVTNMAVHLKRGKDNALVWVTALDSGKPVAEAEVRVAGCDGKELWRGKTDRLGRAAIDQPLVMPYCRYEGSFLFASARLGEDYSFVRSDWNEGIEPWRFGVETWGESADFKIHTVFDRSLFRPGQTVSMKHIARGRNSKGFLLPGDEALPTKLTVRQAETGAEFTQPLVWDKNGSAVSQWKIPESAKRGTYEVALAGSKRGMIVSGEFRVADFRLPVFTGSVQGVPVRQVAPAKVPLALGLSFLNGGAAKGAGVEVSSTLRPRWPTYAHYERFNFTIDFNDEALAAFGVGRDREEEHLVLDKQQLTLDKAGAAKLDVALPEKPKGPSELYTEMTFTDPNGEIQTIHGTVELWPAAVTLGISIADWASGG